MPCPPTLRLRHHQLMARRWARARPRVWTFAAAAGLVLASPTAGAAPRGEQDAATARAATTATTPHHARWVIGYYPVYQRDLMPVGEIDWSAMTHLAVGAV